MADSCKKGNQKACVGKPAEIAKRATRKQIQDFSGTPTANLPERVKAKKGKK